MARSTYFDLSRSADACLGSESGYAQRFQCGNVVKPLIWTGMIRKGNKIARLIVVNPDIEAVVNRVCQTLDHDETGLQVGNIQGLECLQDHRLTFVKPKAEQITSPLLDAILGR